MNRRTLLAAAALAPLASCGAEPRPRRAPQSDPRRIRYGDHPSQFGELHLPEGEPRGVAVVVHGGFWLADYGVDLGTPLAADLAAEGVAAWNLEYRRVGDGGGWPETADDIGRGIDALSDVSGLDLGRVVAVGHSAGAQLALVAAGRKEPVVPLTGVVAQAGVLDLQAAWKSRLGNGAVEGFLGGSPAEQADAYAAADPLQRLPLGVPVRCVHGTQDNVVPVSASRAYVDAATLAGDEAVLTEFDGGHFDLIDPSTEAWALTKLGVLDLLG